MTNDRPCARTISSAAIIARYDTEFRPNAVATPKCSTTTAPSTGPTARATFIVTMFIATAGDKMLAGTSCGTIARMAGVLNVWAMPRSSAAIIITGTVTRSAAASTASDAEITVLAEW